MKDGGRARGTGRLAIGVGIAAAGSTVCLAVFFAVGGPFGSINDLGNALTGALSGWLAWRLRPMAVPGSTAAATGAALVGAAIAVVGSALVISGTTGFFLAGLVSSVGFAGIGVWLVVLNRTVASDRGWPPAHRRLGVVTGVLMAVGVATAPGIAMGLDNIDTAPGWIWIGYTGWIGTFILYPVWALWLGRLETARTGDALSE